MESITQTFDKKADNFLDKVDALTKHSNILGYFYSDSLSTNY